MSDKRSTTRRGALAILGGSAVAFQGANVAAAAQGDNSTQYINTGVRMEPIDGMSESALTSHACFFSHPLLSDGQIHTRTLSESMAKTVRNERKVAWFEDMHSLPAKDLAGRRTQVVPTAESPDLRPTELVELAESVKIPRVNVNTRGKKAIVTVEGEGRIDVEVGEGIETRTKSVEAAYLTRDGDTGSVNLQPVVTVRNHGKLSVVE